MKPTEQKLEVTVSQNQEGYEPEFWGYIIRRNGDVWSDGGYATKNKAISAANKAKREIGSNQ